MAVPQVTALRMMSGDTYKFDVTITEGGRPVNLTNSVLDFAAADMGGAEAVVIAKSSSGVDGGISITDYSGGVARVTIDPTDTEDFDTPVTLRWDIQLTIVGDVYTVARGTLAVTPDHAPAPALP